MDHLEFGCGHVWNVVVCRIVDNIVGANRFGEVRTILLLLQFVATVCTQEGYAGESQDWLMLQVQPPVLLAAGDIADCGPGAERTARIIGRRDGVVIAVGDLAYPNGGSADFRRCYGPTWGPFTARTLPAPGNHDYGTPGATSYLSQFGGRAGRTGRAYYSVEFHAWHLVALDSQRLIAGDPGQLDWLREDLNGSSARCLLAFFHHPRFSSGEGGDNADLDELWRALVAGGVSVAIAGHDHLYERLAPLGAKGNRDPGRGIRAFTVGTGGARLDPAPWFRKSFSESLITGEWGILRIDLAKDRYQWAFETPDGRILDHGDSICVSRAAARR